jgi:hypothetical protein
LDDLWISVRQAILRGLVSDFFTDLRSYTEKAFSRYSDMLVKFSRSQSQQDWLSRFVFRVVIEAKIGSYLEMMRQGAPLNLAKLYDLIREDDTAQSFQNEPILVQAGQDYLVKLLDQAQNPEDPRRILKEALEFVALLKKKYRHLDFWESQNRWFDLLGQKNYLKSMSLDEQKDFLALGAALGFESLFTIES